MLKFTDRQLEVLKYVAMGKTYWEIGKVLGISAFTAKNHVVDMCDLAGTVNRMGLVWRALQLRIIEPPAYEPMHSEEEPEVIHIRSREPVTVGEVEIHVPYAQAVLLREFMRRENRIFTLQNLSDILWEGRRQDNTLRSHIMKLRKSLLQTRYDIQTVYGTGYRFIRIKG